MKPNLYTNMKGSIKFGSASQGAAKRTSSQAQLSSGPA